MQGTLESSDEDVVKTSVLAPSWRNLWKYVPVLDLKNHDFPQYNTFLTFVDSFLAFNSESCLEKFTLKYNCDGVHQPETGLIGRWINTIVTRKVEHIDVSDDSQWSWDSQLPLTIYTCESLVTLRLCGLTLPSPTFVSLPSLKVMILIIPKFADDLALETLIPQCPVLETLVIDRSFRDDMDVLRVRSQSLLNFTHLSDSDEGLVENLVVSVDAPKLEYLRLSDHRVASFILNKPGSLVYTDIDIVFNMFHPDDISKRIMIRNFLLGIFTVKDMTITSSTLEVIYGYSRCEPLPLFRNLSFLRVEFDGYKWEMLLFFIEGSTTQEKEGISILSGPRRFLSSLEYVEIERPLKGEAIEMQLVSYFLGNSITLKKMTLCLDDSIKKEGSVILKQLLTIPRLSPSCQVVVL